MTGAVRARVSSGHRPVIVEDLPQALEVGEDGTVKWAELARALPHGCLRQGCR
jgi:hypothetical protein